MCIRDSHRLVSNLFTRLRILLEAKLDDRVPKKCCRLSDFSQTEHDQATVKMILKPDTNLKLIENFRPVNLLLSTSIVFERLIRLDILDVE